MLLAQRLQPHPRPLEGERLKHGRRGRRRRPAAPASDPAARLPGCAPAGGPVGMMKSRWRTSANAPTTPTKATTAADLHQVVHRGGEARRGRPAAARSGPPAIGMDDASLAHLARPTWPPAAAHRPGAAPRVRWASCCSAAVVCATIWLWKTAPEHGDPGGDAHLAERVVGARGHAAALGLHDRDGARGQHRVDDADPEAADDETGQQHGPGGVGVGRRHQEEPARDEQHADARAGSATAPARSGGRRRRTTKKISSVRGRKRMPAASGP